MLVANAYLLPDPARHSFEPQHNKQVQLAGKMHAGIANEDLEWSIDHVSSTRDTHETAQNSGVHHSPICSSDESRVKEASWSMPILKETTTRAFVYALLGPNHIISAELHTVVL